MPKPHHILFFCFLLLACGQPTAMKLSLPKSTTADSLSNNPHQLTLLIFSDSGMYAYRGANLQNGLRYSPKELKQLLQTDTSLVVIKPSKDATYKNTVNALDIMVTGHVKKYALVDITPKEEAFLTRLLAPSM